MSTEIVGEWPFDITPDTAVVTTSHVTERRMPILEVIHEEDEEDGIVWQFHAGNGDYAPSFLQLVKLEEIVRLDPSVMRVAGLPVGGTASRRAADGEWVVEVGR